MDPYGLPRFAGDEALAGWTDHSRIETRTLRVFTNGPLTATIISHPGVWDLIVSDGRGGVSFSVLPPDGIAAALHLLE